MPKTDFTIKTSTKNFRLKKLTFKSKLPSKKLLLKQT
jgi:hypothetical protein